MWKIKVIDRNSTGEEICGFLNEKKLKTGEVVFVEGGSKECTILFFDGNSDLIPAKKWFFIKVDKRSQGAEYICRFLNESGLFAAEILISESDSFSYGLFYYRAEEIRVEKPYPSRDDHPMFKCIA